MMTDKPATSTQTLELSNEWQCLGAGPMLIATQARGVLFAIGDEKPTLPAGVGFPVPNDIVMPVDTYAGIWVVLAPDENYGVIIYAAKVLGRMVATEFPTLIVTPYEDINE